MNLPKVDGLHSALSLAVTALTMLWFNAREDKKRVQQQKQALEKQLRELKEQPERAEFRIERFDLIWYPTVTASIQTMEVTNVAVGVPHCGKCAVPLGLDKNEWVCARCNARHPESIADSMVTDTVSKQAIQYFKERRPGYKVAVKGLKPS